MYIYKFTSFDDYGDGNCLAKYNTFVHWYEVYCDDIKV